METNSITHTIKVSGEPCEVTAVKSGKHWSAHGEYKGKSIQGQSAGIFKLAFDYWKNKAEMVADSLEE